MGEEFPINVQVAELPPGVDAMIISSVERHEIRKGETAIEALARLRRAVVLKGERRG